MDIRTMADMMGFDAGFTARILPYEKQLMENSSEEFPFFMEKEYYAKFYPWCGGPDPAEIFPLMESVAEIVRNNPAAARYASMMHYTIYKSRPALPVKWAAPTVVFGKNTGIFQLLIGLSSLSLIEQKYAELNLPEKYLRGIARWIGGTIAIYASAHNGYPGQSLNQLQWLRNSVEGRLFRCGRLEFLPRNWSLDLPAVYRSRNDRSLAVLCLDGWAFDAEGFRVNPETTRPVFTARLVFKDGKVTGMPVTPFGKPVRDRELTLDLREWEPLCAPWEQVVTVHIPAGGGMTPEAVKASFIEAKQLFREYLGKDIKVFTCGSWILNPAWEKELPDSNMAALMRNVYLTPCPPPAGNPGVFFVYGDDSCDPRERPRTTKLHQAFCRILDRNEPLRAGYMFLPADEAEHFGTEYYRKRYVV